MNTAPLRALPAFLIILLPRALAGGFTEPPWGRRFDMYDAMWQAYSSLYERCIVVGATVPNPPGRFNTYGRFVEYKSKLSSIVGSFIDPKQANDNGGTYEGIPPTAAITTLTHSVILARAGSPSDWFAWSPRFNLSTHSNGMLFYRQIITQLIWTSSSLIVTSMEATASYSDSGGYKDIHYVDCEAEDCDYTEGADHSCTIPAIVWEDIETNISANLSWFIDGDGACDDVEAILPFDDCVSLHGVKKSWNANASATAIESFDLHALSYAGYAADVDFYTYNSKVGAYSNYWEGAIITVCTGSVLSVEPDCSDFEAEVYPSGGTNGYYTRAIASMATLPTNGLYLAASESKSVADAFCATIGLTGWGTLAQLTGSAGMNFWYWEFECNSTDWSWAGGSGHYLSQGWILDPYFSGNVAPQFALFKWNVPNGFAYK